MRQKQVDECLARALERRKGPGKCQAAVQDGVMVVLHHQHEVLRYLLPNGEVPGEVVYAWHEKETDKRVLDAAIAALRDDAFLAGPHKGASIVLPFAFLAIECVRKSIHLSRP